MGDTVSESGTKPDTFTTADGTKVSANFMNREGLLSYEDGVDAVLARLPLEAGQVSVIIALPKGDLGGYEAKLTAGTASVHLPDQTARVALSLPKFSFATSSFSLRILASGDGDGPGLRSLRS